MCVCGIRWIMFVSSPGVLSPLDLCLKRLWSVYSVCAHRRSTFARYVIRHPRTHHARTLSILASIHASIHKENHLHASIHASVSVYMHGYLDTCMDVNIAYPHTPAIHPRIHIRIRAHIHARPRCTRRVSAHSTGRLGAQSHTIQNCFHHMQPRGRVGANCVWPSGRANVCTN